MLQRHHTLPTAFYFTALPSTDTIVCLAAHEVFLILQDLSRLGCDLARTVLVDNSPFSFLLQPSNGLPVRPFSGQSLDTDLLTVRRLCHWCLGMSFLWLLHLGPEEELQASHLRLAPN